MTPNEDDALIAYCQLMDATGTAATKQQVLDTANFLRNLRIEEPAYLSNSWYRVWRAVHPQVSKSTLRAVERARKVFEAREPDNLEEFCDNIEDAITKLGIGGSEFWNSDECGLRVGYLASRPQVLVMQASRRRRPELVDPANRESVTLIVTINAVGDSIPR